MNGIPADGLGVTYEQAICAGDWAVLLRHHVTLGRVVALFFYCRRR